MTIDRPSLPRLFLWNSLKIALVVGTVLNLINQGQAIVGDPPVSWTRIVLNYCVPFCVAYYSAIKNSRPSGLHGQA